MNKNKILYLPSQITSVIPRWLFSIIYVLILLILTYCLVPVRFETNDDSGMAKILSGGATGAPYPKTIFMSTLYGQLICNLYRLLPGIPWYTLAFWLLLLVSLACILKSLFKLSVPHNKSSLGTLLLFTVLYILLFWYYICFLQFTVVSGICVSASVMLLFARRKEIDSSAEQLVDLVIAVLLLYFGIWIRYSAAIVVLPFLFLALFWQMADLQNQSPRPLKQSAIMTLKKILTPNSIRQLLTAIVICAIAFVFMNGYESFYNCHNPEWKEFEIYSYYRGLYTDYPTPTYEEAQEMYDAIGWTPELVSAANNWFMLDERLSLENFRFIQENKDIYLKSSVETFSGIPSWMNILFVQQNGLAGYGTLLILFATIVLCTLYASSKYWMHALWSFCTGIGSLCIITFLLYQSRLPSRVFMCILIPALLLLTSIFLTCQTKVFLTWKVAYPLFSLLCICTTLFLVWQFGLLSNTTAKAFCAVFILLLLIGIFLSLLPLRHLKKLRNKKRFVLFFPLCIIAIYLGATTLVVGISLHENRSSLHVIEDYGAVEAYIQQHPENLYIYDTSSDMLYPNSPLNAVGTKSNYNLLFYGGSLAKSPMFYDQLNALGRTELFAQNFTEDGIYFIEDLKHHQLSIIPCHEDGSPYTEEEQKAFLLDRIYNKTLSVLLRSDYGIEKIEIVDTIGDLYCVYRYLP